MKSTRIIWYAITGLTALAMLAVSVTATAQVPTRSSYGRGNAAAKDSSRAERDRAADLKGFRGAGIAAKLNTTPEALAAAYARARQANPRLNRGQFIAAHMVAANLGRERPNVTSQALLAGLQNGRSIGQTLRSLGLTRSEAKAAMRTADRQRKDAERRVKADDRARVERDRAADFGAFREMGIAERLNTTPDALAAAYARARQENPRLNRGQFIAAHVLAAELGDDRPGITTPALLSGLREGRSLGQSLQRFGLSPAEARAATRTADRQLAEAGQRVKTERRAAHQRAKRESQGHRPGSQ